MEGLYCKGSVAGRRFIANTVSPNIKQDSYLFYNYIEINCYCTCFTMSDEGWTQLKFENKKNVGDSTKWTFVNITTKNSIDGLWKTVCNEVTVDPWKIHRLCKQQFSIPTSVSCEDIFLIRPSIYVSSLVFFFFWSGVFIFTRPYESLLERD